MTLFILGFALIGCAAPKAAVYKALPPKEPCNVVLLDREDIDRPFVVLGLLTMVELGIFYGGFEKTIEELRKSACKIGGDAITDLNSTSHAVRTGKTSSTIRTVWEAKVIAWE
jgi:hypothetical protein